MAKTPTPAKPAAPKAQRKPKAVTPKTAAPKQAKPKAAAAKSTVAPKTEPKAKAPTRKPGRPSKFSEQIADSICLRLSVGETMVDILSSPDMPTVNTVWQWRKDRPAFQEAYVRAREEQMHAWADQIVSLADDSSDDWMTCRKADGSTFEKFNRDHVQRVSLQIDTRKWLMARVNRSSYGDNQKIDLTATIESKDDRELLHELEQAATALGLSVAELMGNLSGKKA